MNGESSEQSTGAICDLLEHEPLNKDVADKIKDGHCPNCNSATLIRWCPGTGFHDLCTHFHCITCDSDYCWPIAWEPTLPVTKMKGKLCPRERRMISDICERQNIPVPDFWIPIMKSDLKPKIQTIILHCYECRTEKQLDVITEAGYWHWKQGCHPRGWVDTDNDLDYDKKRKTNILYARCPKCYKEVCNG